MSVIDMNELQKVINENYSIAKESIKMSKQLQESAISNRIPGYDVETLEFGAYKKDKFTILFADMRYSTERAKRIGPENTFCTLHAIIPAMIHIIQAYKGRIIDIPGDGVMAIFKEEMYLQSENIYLNSQSLAVKASQELLNITVNYINKKFIKDKIEIVNFGIGIDFGEVIITKIGTNKTFDSKAIGDCINNASKMSNGFNKINISRKIYQNLQKELKDDFDEINNKIFQKIRRSS